MHIEFLVEEESAEAALYNLVPKIVGPTASFDVHAYQGKLDLLTSLPSRLRGYSHWLPADWRIVVLVDRDDDDCKALKRKLETAANEAGLMTRSKIAPDEVFQVLNRIAIEELEAWFFGDVEALVAVYPRIPKTLSKKKDYRDPDAIKGGTWEALERILKRAGYHRGGLPKTEVARNVSAHMDPKRNNSKSFQVFSQSLEKMTV